MECRKDLIKEINLTVSKNTISVRTSMKSQLLSIHALPSVVCHQSITSFGATHKPRFCLVCIFLEVAGCKVFNPKSLRSVEKTASQTLVAPRFVVHCSPLSVFVHCWPDWPKCFCIYGLKCSKAITGWMDGMGWK